MSLFDMPTRTTKDTDTILAKKSRTSSKQVATVKGGNDLFAKISAIKDNVSRTLGEYLNSYIVIRDEESLHTYIDRCIEDGIVALDTETTGLDPMLDDIVGFSICSPTNKAAYIPINHIDFITNEKLSNQISAIKIKEELERLNENHTSIVMFNAQFDIRVFRNQIGVNLKCDWDCYLAARCLNENEKHSGLKALFAKYVLNGQADAFSFSALFDSISFKLIPIQTGYVYAAHDADMTLQLYFYQKRFLDANSKECVDRDLVDVAWVFNNIEMPCIKVVADMEDVGVNFDKNYNAVLAEKYHKLLEDKKDELYVELDKYSDEINAFRDSHPNVKLDSPINIGSPVQLAILLYDVLHCPSVDPKSPRGTGKEILKKLNLPICNLILEYRAFAKLIDTYIDKLPECVNPNDNRIHCNFNQYGADTGRFSSDNPNLQNIPSHNKDIRKMFIATDGYVLMSSDYSQQEPKVMAQLCGDEQMLQAYRDKKDLYSEIASLSFNKPYEDCLEFYPDGTTNKEGKERRSQAKSILLGVLYGRGVPSIAEQLNVAIEKAQAIKDSVFKGFPAIKQFEQDSLNMAATYGFVTTLWGRKRRLPAMTLPDYDFTYVDDSKVADVLDFDSDTSVEVPEATKRYWLNKIYKAGFKNKRKVFEEANAQNIYVIDNTKDKDTTKVVNARIQGSAADMSKLAMILIGNDKQLNEWGFRLLIPVHDELIGECPIEHARECRDRFAQLMSEAAKNKLTIPISCDVEVTKAWYGKEVEI